MSLYSQGNTISLYHQTKQGKVPVVLTYYWLPTKAFEAPSPVFWAQPATVEIRSYAINSWKLLFIVFKRETPAESLLVWGWVKCLIQPFCHWVTKSLSSHDLCSPPGASLTKHSPPRSLGQTRSKPQTGVGSEKLKMVKCRFYLGSQIKQEALWFHVSVIALGNYLNRKLSGWDAQKIKSRGSCFTGERKAVVGFWKT